MLLRLVLGSSMHFCNPVGVVLIFLFLVLSKFFGQYLFSHIVVVNCTESHCTKVWGKILPEVAKFSYVVQHRWFKVTTLTATQKCLLFNNCWAPCSCGEKISARGVDFRTLLLSKPQLNHNSTQPNITLSWVRHENDFAYHPPPPQKLNVSYISAVTYPILMKL